MHGITMLGYRYRSNNTMQLAFAMRIVDVLCVVHSIIIKMIVAFCSSTRSTFSLYSKYVEKPIYF